MDPVFLFMNRVDKETGGNAFLDLSQGTKASLLLHFNPIVNICQSLFFCGESCTKCTMKGFIKVGLYYA